MGVSHLLELDGPSCSGLKGSFIYRHASLVALAKDATFLAMGTIWVLAWERWPWMAVPPLGMPWQVEQMEMMEGDALTRCGKR